jgi:Protein of unknown function (DUF2934)
LNVKRIEQERSLQERPSQERSSQASPTSVDPQEAVRRRAYQIYEQRGTAPGSPMQDWLQAESELFDTQSTQKNIQPIRKAA